MTKTANNNPTAWGRSYGDMVRRQFFKSKLTTLSYAFIILLFAVAVLAPFIANDKPYVLRTGVSTATVTITITPNGNIPPQSQTSETPNSYQVQTPSNTENNPPIAADDNISVMVNANFVTSTILANDYDADGDLLYILDITNGAHGKVIDNGDSTISYVPDKGYIGTDTCTYTVTDRHDKLQFPLFRNLQMVDYWIFMAAITAIILVILARRNRKRVDPSHRGAVFTKQIIIAIVVLSVGMTIVALVKSKRLDATNYKLMVESGQATQAIFAPVPYGYERTELKSSVQPPSREHWLGTDDVGSDVLCRLIHGSRISLSVGFIAVGISSVIGIFVGAILGYFGGKIDFIGMRFVEIMMAVPTFFLIITIVAFFERSLINIMVIIGVTSWTGVARFIRAEFFKLRKQDFVQAALALGLPLRSVLFKHMLPNGIAPVLVSATFGIAGAIFTEAALSFLGFGVAPPTPSWGQMLSQGVSSTGRFLWWLSLFPGLAIFLTVTAYNLVGEGLRDAIDPRLRKAA
ncbi:MAG: ABC transporter permease subunit [Sedimentisphaerales bacterium]|nr:ABC transporter permease subunit [Sedimentisphaerales bacterium]